MIETRILFGRHIMIVDPAMNNSSQFGAQHQNVAGGGSVRWCGRSGQLCAVLDRQGEATHSPAPPMAADLVIRNGRIVDGTGAPSYIGDVAVVDGKISAVGPKLDVTGAQEIDATGKIVAPAWCVPCVCAVLMRLPMNG